MSDEVQEIDEVQELERCPFCGAMLVDPCDRVPPSYCERALEAMAKKGGAQ